MDDFTFNLFPEGAANKLHTQNDSGKDFRETLVQSPRGSPLQTKIRIVEVHHGNMIHRDKPYPSTLIVLEFRFQSQEEAHRYKSAKMRFEFFDKATAARGGSDWDPAIVKVAPSKMHFLNRIVWDRRTKKEANIGAKGGAGDNGVNGEIRWEVEEAIPVKHGARLTALTSRSKSKKSGEENAVEWSMEENKGRKPREGVPPFLQAAVLLRRRSDGPNRPFIVKLRVESDVDFASGMLRGLPWKTDEDKVIDTATFNPAMQQVGVSSVTKIVPKQLEEMHVLPVENYFKVILNGDTDAGQSGAPSILSDVRILGFVLVALLLLFLRS
ncbi:hypothetical protein V8C34DRAFT_125231 [Trichoderma compactum]